MKEFKGNVEITQSNYKKWEKKLKRIDVISGDLSIYSKVKLDNLKSIGGNLYINSKTKLDNLKSVGGNLYIYSQVKLHAPNLKSVGGNLDINSKTKLDNLKSVGGGLYIYSQAKLQAPNLKSVGGNLNISSKIDNDLAIRLVNNCFKHQWYLSDEANNSLLRVKFPKAKYLINNVYFEKELFDKVRKDKLTAQEVFALTNLEQRRIAYERMDKVKMKQLKGFKVLDKVKDERGKIMKIVSFKIDGFDTPFYFLNVVCPTGREYFIETRKTKCFEAKTNSFGLPSTARAVKEW